MQKARWNVLILFSALAMAFLGAHANAAPQPGEQSQNEQTAKKETSQDSTIYRVSYKVNEMENGKVINSRSYTLMAKPGTRASTSVGSRVPVIIPGKSIEYKSIGILIQCHITKKEGNLFVETDMNISTVAGEGYSPSSGTAPVLRQMSLGDVTSAVMGKAALVGIIDDTASNQHYIIEVTVTKAE